jgi:hypothetical protein
LVNGTNQHFN